MLFNLIEPKTSIPEIQWPAIPTALGAQIITTLSYLDKSQWLNNAEIFSHQEKQLTQLIQYACQHVPWYQENYAPFLTAIRRKNILDYWNDLPILTRKRKSVV